MLDELLYRFGRRALRRPGSKVATPLGQVMLEDEAGRLQVVASTMEGRLVTVCGAEGVGGAVGGQVHLPTRSAWFEDAAWNREAFLLRLLFGLRLQRRGRSLLGAAPTARLDLWQRQVATLLLWPSVEEDLGRTHPRWAERWRFLLGELAVELPVKGDPATRFLAEWAESLRSRGRLPEPVARGLAEQPLAAEDPAALRRLAQDLDRALRDQDRRWWGWRPRAAAPSSPSLLWFSGLLCNPPPGGRDPTEQGGGYTAEALPQGSERAGKQREEVEIIEQEPDPDEENPVLHLFEKIETAEEYQGTQRLRDGTDEIDEHEEALEELDLTTLLRTRQGSSSLYRAEVALESGAEEGNPTSVDPAAILYDEWDGRQRRYRRNYCRVFESRPQPRIDEERLARTTAELRRRLRQPIQRLRSAFVALNQQQRLRSRQRDGAELDLDAFIEGLGRQARGGVMGDQIWWHRRPRHRDLAVSVLVDSSLSADSWVAGRRVLDVARDACFMLGEVLTGQGIEFGIAGFHSFTRHDCRYLRIKGFSESFRSAQPRLFGLEPDGFTRIGPAIRHGCAELNRSRARRRLLILLSDGKATDHDSYEGRYGTADVRQAVREATRSGTHCFALAIEKEARHYLSALFGRGGFEVMSRPEDLPDRIGLLLERCLASS